MDLRLAGKVVVVTGASKGIGLAVTTTLVGEGALSPPDRSPTTSPSSTPEDRSTRSKWIWAPRTVRHA